MLRLNSKLKCFLPILFAVATLTIASQTAYAQVGTGEVTFGVGGTTVYNGGSNASTTLNPSTAYTLGLNLEGVTGNGGPTYYACYVTPQGGGTTELISGSTSTSGLITFQWSTGASPTTYVFYCTATYNGHGSGTVTTPTITATT